MRSTGISTASGTGTITDDDPKFSINSPSVSEGDSSTSNLVFTVTLSGTRSSSSPLTVDYASSDGTATAGTDYTAVSGTLTFASGETSKTVAVSVTGDTTDESNETVALTLSNAIGRHGHFDGDRHRDDPGRRPEFLDQLAERCGRRQQFGESGIHRYAERVCFVAVHGRLCRCGDRDSDFGNRLHSSHRQHADVCGAGTTSSDNYSVGDGRHSWTSRTRRWCSR